MDTILSFYQVMFSINANSFLYFFSKIPVLGRIISAELYRKSNFKKIYGVLGLLFDLIKSASAQFVVIYLLISYLPSLLGVSDLNDPTGRGLSVTLFLILFSFLPAFLESSIFKNQKEDYIFLNQFSFNPDHYYRLKIIREMVRSIITTLPALIFIFNDFSIVLLLSVVRIFWSLVGNVWFLHQYKTKRKLVSVYLRYGMFLVLAISTYILLYFKLLPSFLPNGSLAIIISIVLILLMIPLWVSIIKYSDYKEVAVQFANKDVLTVRVSVTTVVNEDETGLKGFTWEKNKEFLEKHKKENVFAYIESVFNERLRKSIWNTPGQQIIQNLIIFVALALLVRFDVLHLDKSRILDYSTLLISFAMSMTYSHFYLQICFRNLDLPLLYHHLYSRKSIVQSMHQRGLFLLKVGLLMVSSFAIGLFLFIFIAQIEIPIETTLQLLLNSVLVFLIFELFHFLAYYVLQPYSMESTIKNPLFQVLSIVESLFTMFFLFARQNILSLTVPLLLVLFGLIVCYFVTTKYVDKSFKLKY